MFCILGWPGSWSLRSWVRVRLIQSLRLAVIHLWHPHKKWTISSPPPPLSAKMINCSKTIESANTWKFQEPPTHLLWVVINLCPLIQITLFPFFLWQITLLLPETYCKLTQTEKSSKIYLKPIILTYHIKYTNSLNKWLLKSDIAWLSYITKALLKPIITSNLQTAQINDCSKMILHDLVR